MSGTASRFVVRSDGSNCQVLSYADWKADRQEGGGSHGGDTALTFLEMAQIMAIAAFCSTLGLACAIGAYALTTMLRQ